MCFKYIRRSYAFGKVLNFQEHVRGSQSSSLGLRELGGNTKCEEGRPLMSVQQISHTKICGGLCWCILRVQGFVKSEWEVNVGLILHRVRVSCLGWVENHMSRKWNCKCSTYFKVQELTFIRGREAIRFMRI